MKTWLALSWSIGTFPCVTLCLHLPQGAWLAAVAYHLGCYLAAKPLVASRSPLRWRWRQTLILIASMGLCLPLFWWIMPYWDWERAREVWQDWGLTPGRDRIWLAYFFLVNSVIEERYWRAGLLGERSKALLGTHRARMLSILAFVPFHAMVLVPSFGSSAILALLGIGLGGAIWVWAFERGVSLAGVVASHAGVNLAVVVAYVYFQ